MKINLQPSQTDAFTPHRRLRHRLNYGSSVRFVGDNKRILCEKKHVFPFFAKVSVSVHNVLYICTLQTDTPAAGYRSFPTIYRVKKFYFCPGKINQLLFPFGQRTSFGGGRVSYGLLDIHIVCFPTVLHSTGILPFF